MNKSMFKIGLAGALALTTSIAASTAAAQHVWWNNSGCGDIMQMMVNVSSADTATTTYYETLGWNQGANAGGYTGIQSTNSGPAIIFSLWNPVTPVTKQITAAYVNPTGVFKPFGGEGTGYQYLNYNAGWSLNSWYLQFVRAWQYKGDTYFGMWLYDVTNKSWMHHITMDYPLPNVSFCTGTVSFLENYGGTVPSTYRHVNLTGGWKRLASGAWEALNKASVDGALTNYGSAVLDGYNSVFMQTGVSTNNNFDKYNINFSNVLPPFNTTTCTKYVSSQSSVVNTTNKTLTYTWQINPSQNPQFAYELNLINKTTHAIIQTVKDVNPEARSVVFTNVTQPLSNLVVMANITDIYDIAHSNTGW